MWKLSFKIWATANAMVLLVCLLFLPPQAKQQSLFALVYSSFFSLPGIPALYGLFSLLRFAQGRTWFSWAVTAIVVALVAFTAYWLFALVDTGLVGELDIVLLLSFVCGYCAVLAFHIPLHQLFLQFQFAPYEND